MGVRQYSYDQYCQISPAERRSQASKKTLEVDAYANDYTFFVRVLTTPVPLGSNDLASYISSLTPGSGPEKINLKSFSFKGRIENTRERPSPHRCLPDPNNYALSEDHRNLTTIMHTTFVASYGWQGDFPVAGDVVKVTLEPGDFSFNLQRAHFDTIHVDAKFAIQAGFSAASSKAAFGNNKSLQLGSGHTIVPIEIPDVKGKAYKTTNEFMQSLRDSGHFSDFTDMFLAALTANALAESTIGRTKNALPGLDWVVGDPVAVDASDDRKKRSINGWCSHGYWQLNVCGAEYEGALFASQHGINISDDAGKKEFAKKVNNEDALFAWMAARMKEIPEIAQFVGSKSSAHRAGTSGRAAAAITKFFERPAGCGAGGECLKAVGRSKQAEKIYVDWLQYLAAKEGTE